MSQLIFQLGLIPHVTLLRLVLGSEKGNIWAKFLITLVTQIGVTASKPVECLHTCILSCSDSLWPMDCSSPLPLSVGFPRRNYWSGLPFSSPGDLPDPGIKPILCLLHNPLSDGFFTTGARWEAHLVHDLLFI